MKFVISRQELTQLIRSIQNIAPPSPPIPILSNILIEAEGHELVLTATDLTVGARCHGQAKVLERGSLLVPSKRFFQLVRELTDQTLEVTGSPGEMVEIKAGSSRFRLNGMEKSTYPQLPDLENAIRFSVPSGTFKDMLYRTAFSVSKEDNRFVLNGLLFRILDTKIIVVGTDGKRLAKAECATSLPAELSGEYILPIKAVDELIKMLPDEGEAILYLLHDKVAVECNQTLLVTKLLAGEYPDFQQIIASSGEIKLELHRDEMITLLRQISLFTTDLSQSARFTFQAGELILTANCADVGEGKVSMPVNYSQDLLEIAFNPQYFLDILKHSKDETITLSVTDAYNPGVITDSTDSLFIIMPLRLDDDH